MTTKNTAPASDRDVTSTSNETIRIPNAELLGIETMTLERRLTLIEQKADRVPEITSDEAAGPWQELVAKDGRDLGHDIEESRNAMLAPFANGVEVINAHHFGMHAPRKGMVAGRLQVAMTKVTGELLAYFNRKEATERARLKAIADEQRRIEDEQRRKAQEEEDKRQAAIEEGRKRAATNADQRGAVAEAAAETAGARAFEAEQQSISRPADLVRNRSAGGTTASTKVEWEFAIDDITAVKGAALWSLVTRAAKEQAIRLYIKSNAPTVLAEGQDWQPLAGVRMVCKRGLQIRS